MLHTNDKIYYKKGVSMNMTISMGIRVSEDELNKLKQAARLEAYASYIEFIRRTALIEAEKVIQEKTYLKKRRNN